MKPQPPSKPITIILPKRKCANCGALLPQGHKYPTCNWFCHQQHQAKLAAIDAADKEGEAYPF